MAIDFPIHEFDRSLFSSTGDRYGALWEVAEPPQKLFVQGRSDALALLERLPHDGLAIVGTRAPQPRSRTWVRRVVSELHGTPLIIISGFARGIDTEAHQTALAAGLPTIAILGTALDVNYPAENLELRRKILYSGGLIITEIAPLTPVYPSFFTRRNRLIAGWSKATWIVEAGTSSGALNTACWARKQDRLCYVTPCFPGDRSLAGNQNLLAEQEARALWATESLGESWNFLATPYSTRQRMAAKQRGAPFPLLELVQETAEQKLPPVPDFPDARELLPIIHEKTFINGGASTEELLNWSIAQGWSPQRFFSALQDALRHGWAEDQNGLLVMN